MFKRVCVKLLAVAFVLIATTTVFANSNGGGVEVIEFNQNGEETVIQIEGYSQEELVEKIEASFENISEINYTQEKDVELIDVTFELIQENDKSARAVGYATASFRRESSHYWSCTFTVVLPEPITQLSYRLDWKDGTVLTSSASPYTKSWTSSRHYNLYLRAGTYKPSISVQVYSASGPWGSISVPDINTIAILSDY